MTTFTPGPWRVERGANSHLFDGIVCAGDEGIAFVDMDDDGPSPNARLIAAAPALYEALKEIAIDLLLMRNHIRIEIQAGQDRWDGMPEFLTERLAVINGALASADGKAK
jgi:hypothetical protein